MNRPLTIRLASAEECMTPGMQFWLRHLAGEKNDRVVMAPNRKLWEHAAILDAAWRLNLLQEGRRAIGFGVGREVLPAALAAYGVDVLATDQSGDSPNAQQYWWETGQLSRGKDDLAWHGVCDADEWEHVTHAAVDMRAIPETLMRGEFDLAYSAGSLDHLGSWEAGLQFIRDSLRCVRPGGAAIHTTEFDLGLQGTPVSSGSTVFYRREEIEGFVSELRSSGYVVGDVDLSWPEDAATREIDYEPYTRPNEHITLEASGVIATSIIIIVQRPIPSLPQ